MSCGVIDGFGQSAVAPGYAEKLAIEGTRVKIHGIYRIWLVRRTPLGTIGWTGVVGLPSNQFGSVYA